MDDKLEKYQTLSVITKVVVTIIALIQGIIVIRLLSTSEYGLVGIVVAAGGIAGVLQHLGLGTGSIREIASVSNKRDASKVLFTSLAVRLVISLPIAAILFFAAGYIGEQIYNYPEIVFPLRLYAIVLILQGIVEVLSSTLSGLRKFKELFIYQIVYASLSLVIFAVMLNLFGFNGYFYGMVALHFIVLLILIAVNIIFLGREIDIPKKEKFKNIFSNLFKIGATTYLLKIMYMLWQRAPVLIAGLFLSAEKVGYIHFAIFLGMKTTFFIDAVSSVNLPVMTSKFKENIEKFKKDFKNNYDIIFSIVLFLNIAFIIFSKEIITIIAGPDKYAGSFGLIPFFIMSFLLYSLINLLGASVILPALMLKEAIKYYVILCFVSCSTILTLFLLNLNEFSAAIGMFLGVMAAFWVQVRFINKNIKLKIMNTPLLILILLSILTIAVLYTEIGLLNKIFLVIIFAIAYSKTLKKYNLVEIKEIIKKVVKSADN